jgi:hypothetical protein
MSKIIKVHNYSPLCCDYNKSGRSNNGFVMSCINNYDFCGLPTLKQFVQGKNTIKISNNRVYPQPVMYRDPIDPVFYPASIYFTDTPRRFQSR